MFNLLTYIAQNQHVLKRKTIFIKDNNSEYFYFFILLRLRNFYKNNIQCHLITGANV